jgi:hypothetical protein
MGSVWMSGHDSIHNNYRTTQGRVKEYREILSLSFARDDGRQI